MPAQLVLSGEQLFQLLDLRAPRGHAVGGFANFHGGLALGFERGQLGDMLGLKVGIKHSPKGGSVTLAYSSLDQLDMICQRLSGDKF